MNLAPCWVDAMGRCGSLHYCHACSSSREHLSFQAETRARLIPVPVADHTSVHGLLYFFPAYPFPYALSVAADKAVSMQQGLCYRSLGSGTCTLPLVHRITKQICCCSRVGKAWGSTCEQCPLPGTGNPTLRAQPWPSKSVTTSPAWIGPFKQRKLSLPSGFQTWDTLCSHHVLSP
jgi:hypothetical protein